MVILYAFTCLTLITITMMEINTASSPTKGLSIAATVGVKVNEEEAEPAIVFMYIQIIIKI